MFKVTTLVIFLVGNIYAANPFNSSFFDSLGAEYQYTNKQRDRLNNRGPEIININDFNYDKLKSSNYLQRRISDLSDSQIFTRRNGSKYFLKWRPSLDSVGNLTMYASEVDLGSSYNEYNDNKTNLFKAMAFLEFEGDQLSNMFSKDISDQKNIHVSCTITKIKDNRNLDWRKVSNRKAETMNSANIQMNFQYSKIVDKSNYHIASYKESLNNYIVYENSQVEYFLSKDGQYFNKIDKRKLVAEQYLCKPYQRSVTERVKKWF